MKIKKRLSRTFETASFFYDKGKYILKGIPDAKTTPTANETTIITKFK